MLDVLELPPVTIPAERIHVLEEPEFRERVSAQAEAKTIFGHVYVPRKTDPVEFSAFLTHELAHAASRYELQVVQSADERHLKAWQRRMGLTFQPKPNSDPDFETLFNGFNEAVTEICATELRGSVAEHLTDLDDTQRAELTRRREYRPVVMVIEALMRLVADKEGCLYESIREDLLRDYFSGTFRFVKKLEKWKKGATRILRGMGSDPPDALKAAKLLGLADVHAEISASEPFRSIRSQRKLTPKPRQ
jgi:hypothetical protein